MSEPFRVDRRTTIKWVLAASAVLPATRQRGFGEATVPAAAPSLTAKGYGTDPDLTRIYEPGNLWPLTLTAERRRTTAALCDLIIPADAESPSASAVGVVDFLDEWISAPYQAQYADRATLLDGLEWLDAESLRRFVRRFADIDEPEKAAICDEICYLPKANLQLSHAALFFARFRDLTVGGFYTTPEGMRDLKYVGNVALARFDGPPPEVLRRVGLSEQPTRGES
ncbi:MAG: gluconate 2-dehydrogenase subunit 3 family protein [Steroidobacteraceae bacterium]